MQQVESKLKTLAQARQMRSLGAAVGISGCLPWQALPKTTRGLRSPSRSPFPFSSLRSTRRVLRSRRAKGVEYCWREAVFDVVKRDIMMLFGKDTLAAHRLVSDCEDDVLLDKNNGFRKVLNSTSEPMTGLIGLDMLGI